MMNKKENMIKRILIIGLVFIFLGVGFVFILFGSCSRTYLSDKVFSPDGKYFVQVEDSSCGGAAGDYRTDVRVSNLKSFFSNFGIFTTRTGNSKNIFASNGSGAAIKTSWVDNRTLKVNYSNCGTIHGRDNGWKDIKIVYEGECSEDK